MRKYAVLFLLGALVFSSCPTESGDGFSKVRIIRSGIPGDLMGMVHAGKRPEVKKEYELLNELGVQWMLNDFSWSDIQTGVDTWNPDAFKPYADNGENNGKKILAILDYDTSWLHSGYDGPIIKGPDEIEKFRAYVKKTVTRYKDRVDAWCIWNEPNLQPRFWATGGTKEDFFALTKAAAETIREAAPDAIIIGGAFYPLGAVEWARGFLEYEGIKNLIDGIAYHPYMPNPDASSNVFNTFKQAVSEYGFGDKIWVTEVGYPVQGSLPTKVDSDIMPGTLLQTLVLLTVDGAERIFWYELFDHGDNPSNPNDSENWFGMVNGDGLINGEFQKRPWAYAYRLAAQNIPGTDCVLPQRNGLPSYIQTYHFAGSGGRNALVVWTEITIKSTDIKVYLPGTSQKVYNLATGEAASIGETSTYTLKSKDGDNHFIQFFTWENSNPSQAPRISAY